MGADIHMYIQYKDKKSNYWNCFADEINPGRNYLMFSILAKVRGEYPESFEPKGLPDHDLSYGCEDDLYIHIDDTVKEEGFTTLEKATTWNTNYGCKIVNDKNGNPSKVEHPDWHSYTWMNIKEYKKALKIYDKYAKEDEYLNSSIPCEYQAVLDIMKSLKRSGKKVEVVFWFDN